MPYCLLMDALAKAGHIHEAKSVFDEMHEKCISSGRQRALKQASFRHQIMKYLLINAQCTKKHKLLVF